MYAKNDYCSDSMLLNCYSIQRYVVFVQASNGISYATSNKILVDVMEPISSVRTFNG